MDRSCTTAHRQMRCLREKYRSSCLSNDVMNDNRSVFDLARSLYDFFPAELDLKLSTRTPYEVVDKMTTGAVFREYPRSCICKGGIRSTSPHVVQFEVAI
jgi:hypothetical protein